jgi:hypothetical protein
MRSGKPLFFCAVFPDAFCASFLFVPFPFWLFARRPVPGGTVLSAWIFASVMVRRSAGARKCQRKVRRLLLRFSAGAAARFPSGFLRVVLSRAARFHRHGFPLP